MMSDFYIAGTYNPPLNVGYAAYVDWLISDRDLPEPVATSPYDISSYNQLWFEQYLYGGLAEIKLRIVDEEYQVLWDSGWKNIDNMGYSIIEWNISEIPGEYQINIPGFEILLHTRGEYAIRSDLRSFLAKGEDEEDYAFIA